MGCFSLRSVHSGMKLGTASNFLFVESKTPNDSASTDTRPEAILLAGSGGALLR